MKRLTVHLANVEKINVNGKNKLFNTRAFKLKTGSEKEVLDILGTLSNVTKSYISNIKA